MQWLDRVTDNLITIRINGMIMDFWDILEILIIAILLYYILAWMKTTRAWALLKGVIVIGGFLIIAAFFKMNTILWIAQNVLGFAVTALIVVLQPEFRKALEELGNKKVWRNFVPFDLTGSDANQVSEATINEIVKACAEMGRAKTGALIVLEQKVSLKDFKATGIDVDAIVSSQLLINIFEHNTPLHDGAVIISGNRIAAATCYLHLSANTGLSKELGTRHRAGLGISEESDSLTVIVSEETGKISCAYEGELTRNISADDLRAYLHQILIKETGDSKKRIRIRDRKGRSKVRDEKHVSS